MSNGVASTLGAASISVAMVLVSASWAVAQPTRLEFKGKTGEAIQLESGMKLEMRVFPQGASAPEAVIELGSATLRKDSVVRTHANGDVEAISKFLRLQKFQVFNGKPVFFFDSQDPKSVEATKASPEAQALRAALGMQISLRFDARGRLIDVRTENAGSAHQAQIDRIMEDGISGNWLALPPGPIDVGQNWEIGKRSYNFPGVGRIEYLVRATLKGIDKSAPNGAMALIDLVSETPKFIAAPGKDKNAVQLDHFQLVGDAAFQIGTGRFSKQENDLVMRLHVREPDGRQQRIEARGSIVVREVAASGQH